MLYLYVDVYVLFIFIYFNFSSIQHRITKEIICKYGNNMKNMEQIKWFIMNVKKKLEINKEFCARKFLKAGSHSSSYFFYFRRSVVHLLINFHFVTFPI